MTYRLTATRCQVCLGAGHQDAVGAYRCELRHEGEASLRATLHRLGIRGAAIDNLVARAAEHTRPGP